MNINYMTLTHWLRKIDSFGRPIPIRERVQTWRANRWYRKELYANTRFYEQVYPQASLDGVKQELLAVTRRRFNLDETWEPK